MQRCWDWLIRPTLVRRLLFVQMMLLTVLWGLAVAYIAFVASNDQGLLESRRSYERIFEIAENLYDIPDRQHKLLQLVDVSLRQEQRSSKVTSKSPSIRVYQGGHLIYRSEVAPHGVYDNRSDQIETIEENGVRWHARTLQSPRSDVRVTIIVPEEKIDSLERLALNGGYLMPWLLSFPFLLFPAWLSTRLALRPWHRVAHEVAARGPHNMLPLQFKPRHQELRSMVDNINGLLSRISQTVERERRFIADAAHELRTPLAAMRVNVEALQSHVGDSRRRELLAGIMNGNDRATRLVSQLLMLMRSDATASVVLERLNMAAFLQERLALMFGLATQKQVELELLSDGDFVVLGHREGMESLIDNLVDNAIKYSPQGGTVTISLHGDGREVVLRVADHGPGIAPSLRGRVFDRFFRIPGQIQSGSGLGLTIARAVALQHAGNIRLSATEGNKGLLVEVRLPMAPCC